MNLFLISFFLLFTLELISSKRHKHKKHPPTSTITNLPVPSGTVAPETIPVESSDNCPCASSTSNPCRGGIYVDYYYNAPYSGYPANSSYLPPIDSVPVIIEKLTSIRDTVKDFVQSVGKEDSDVKKAIYVKNNFGNVQYLLQAINNAANSTNINN